MHQPWEVLKVFQGGVTADCAFDWDPPDPPRSSQSWNEAVYGAEPLANLTSEETEGACFKRPEKKAPATFRSFKDFSKRLNSRERSNRRARPILFVGGCHRSGTSVLARLLKQSPLVAGMEDTDAPEDEGQHLQSILPTDEDFGGVGRFALDDRYCWTEATTDPDPASSAEELLYTWGNWWLRSSERRSRRTRADRGKILMRPLLLEKTPSNIVHTRWLRKAFGPAARFLVIVRHPLACALATREFLRDFESPTPTLRDVLRNWVAAHARLEADAVELRRMALLDDVKFGSGDACLLRIYLSDLVRDPAAVLDRVSQELVDAPLHIDADAIAAVVKKGDPDEKYREMWRKWPDAAFVWDEPDTFDHDEKRAPSTRREAGAKGIMAEFAEPFARNGFPRAFKDEWAR